MLPAMKRFMLVLIGIVIGALVGGAVIFGLETASHAFYPPPEGMDLMDPETLRSAEFREWIEGLPLSASVLILGAHGIGTFLGCLLAMLISGRRSAWPAAILGALFLAGTVANLLAVPHPAWFAVIDVSVVVGAAAAAAVTRKPAPPAEG